MLTLPHAGAAGKVSKKDAALAYAADGWAIVALHTVEAGRCSCPGTAATPQPPLPSPREPRITSPSVARATVGMPTVSNVIRDDCRGLNGNAGSRRINSVIVTTRESGLQTVDAVNRFAARIPNARVIVADGDNYHVAAVAPDLCAQHALAFIDEMAGVRP